MADAAGMEETEVCGMHDGDKVGSSAIGNLVRSKNKKVWSTPSPRATS